MFKLQIIAISVAILLAIAALLIFAGILPGLAPAPAETGEIALWGTMPEKLAQLLISDFNQRFKDIKVNYRELKPEAYISELVNALASGAGPDVFLLPQEQILKQKDKVVILDSTVYPLRAYRDNFADLAEIYARPEGIVGLPFEIDPLVLYWNKDLFRNAGLAKAPADWNEFSDAARALKTIEGQKIITAGAAMGEFANIKNAKDILAMLVLQNGNKIMDPETLKPVFGLRGAVLSPGEEALLFFISFSDPKKETYTWNKSQPEALSAFAGGRLAMYLGLASDIENILTLNPHLNFDVSEVPQISGRPKTTLAKSSALAVVKQSQNIPAALTFIYDLTGFNQQELLAKNSFKAPALRTALAKPQKDPVLTVFYQSAIRALGWLDPDPVESRAIWQEMSESVLSGSKRINQAVLDAQRKFETLTPKTN